MTRNLLTAEQTARRLGVKLETIYAYVSRGVLGRTLAADGTSRFDVKEIDELARRGRPRQQAARAGSVEVSLVTAVTGIKDDRLLYRGRDATELATSAPFEAVAELLWSGELPARASWPAPSRALLRSARLVESGGPLERLCVATAALASAHPLRVDLRPENVVEHARLLLATFAETLPLVGQSSGLAKRAPSVAARLFPRLSRLAATSQRVSLLDTALVLLADHELATSTLAARVAASTRADPFSVVLAGLGAISGPLHGKAAVLVQRLLLEAAETSPEEAVARALAGASKLPGFGHPVYRGRDPRAACLLRELLPAAKAEQRTSIARVLEIGMKSTGIEPNVDFALGALAFALDMPLGAGEAVFAIARSAGFIAHALEEYGEAPLRFRARSIYVGPGS